MDNITLYRGDYDKIKEFAFHKAHKHCLVGQGIYLTNSLEVADTYRTKGAREIATESLRSRVELFNGVAANRPEAFVKAFEQFVERKFERQLMLRGEVHKWYAAWGKLSEKEKKKFTDAQRAEWDECLFDGSITSEYHTTYSFGKAIRKIRVEWRKKADVGFVTEFAFPRATFEANILNVSTSITDPFFWELMWDQNIKVGKLTDTRSEYIRINSNSWSTHALCGVASNATPHQYARIREALEPYGIIGFEYRGGLITSGKKHRAFCLWDDAYVNQHAVQRHR